MDDIDKLLDQSRDLNNEGKYYEAEKLLLSIKEKCTNNVLWYYRLAYCLIFTNRFKAAMDLLKQGIKCDKTFPFTYLSLSMLYYWQGALVKAFKCGLKGKKYCEKKYPESVWEFEQILSSMYRKFPFANPDNYLKSVIYHPFPDYDDKADEEFKVKEPSGEEEKLLDYLHESNFIQEINLFPDLPKKGTFLGFILLKDSTFDTYEFMENYKQDWNKELEGPEIDDGIIVCSSDNGHYTVSLLEEPLPLEEVVFDAEKNYRWEEAIKVAKLHKACLVISFITQDPDANLLENSKEFVRLMTTAANMKNAIGVNTLGSVFNPVKYRELALTYLKADLLPVPNLVFIGIYMGKYNTVCSYTIGLENFGKKEMEILESNKSPKEIYYFLLDVADFVIKENVTLKDGDTIKINRGERVPITESPGIALNAPSLKLGFDGFKSSSGIISYN